MAFISSPSVVGTVGRPAARSACTSAARAMRSGFSGSIERQKRALSAVYSWPQQISVSSGRIFSGWMEWNSSSAVPSEGRPQPQ